MAKPRKCLLKDEILRRGLLTSAEEVAAYVLAGKVVVDDQRVASAHIRIAEDADIRIKHLAPFVSRGGEKLWGFLRHHGLTDWVRGKTVLDVGASTGGFTDCCLQLGAKKVYAVDVGTNQLDWKLRSHPSVVAMEQTDVRSLTLSQIPTVGFVCCDVSFLPLKEVIPALFALGLPAGTKLVLLVKPQFELEDVPEGGIVANDADRRRALADCLALVRPRCQGAAITGDSPLAGRKGNRELFIAFTLNDSPGESC